MSVEVVEKGSLGPDVEEFGVCYGIAYAFGEKRFKLATIAAHPFSPHLFARRSVAIRRAKELDKIHRGEWRFQVIPVRISLA